MESTKFLFTAQELLDKRESYNSEISRMWKVILTENVLEKHEECMRTMDLKAAYQEIQRLSKLRVTAKLNSMAANMGFSSVEEAQPFLAKSCFPIIFEIWEVRDRLENWREVKTLNPAVKAKYGKKNMRKREQITSNYKNEEIKKLNLLSNQLQQKLIEFNASHTFDVTKSFEYASIL